MRQRDSSRVVLLDPDDRLLLLRVADDDIVVDGRRAPRTYWITPGGGREPGESFADTARREVREETGLASIRLGVPVWDREADITLFGEDLHALEWYFVGWTDAIEVSFAGHEPHEQVGIVEHRWWTLDDLTADPTLVWFPENLLELYAEARRLRPA